MKNLSLVKAVLEALKPRRFRRKQDKAKQVTSLIEEFNYPRYGPGQMWETATRIIEERGCTVHLRTPVTRIHHRDGRAVRVIAIQDDREREFPCTHVISSMPISHLVTAMDPPPPPKVLAAARALRYRDHITVALVVPKEFSFPDNWIYIHDPGVEVGRIQNFGSWSPYLVKDGRTCLGLEYFVNEGDEMWNKHDDDLVKQAIEELELLGLVTPGTVELGYVVRMPKAYPVYDDAYKQNVDVLRHWLGATVPNVYPVGRNGMHKYNNQDHSMYTAMLSVENILGASHDVWAVNVEEEYHEERSGRTATGSAGTGRAAPLLPSRAHAQVD